MNYIKSRFLQRNRRIFSLPVSKPLKKSRVLTAAESAFLPVKWGSYLVVLQLREPRFPANGSHDCYSVDNQVAKEDSTEASWGL